MRNLIVYEIIHAFRVVCQTCKEDAACVHVCVGGEAYAKTPVSMMKKNIDHAKSNNGPQTQHVT